MYKVKTGSDLNNSGRQVHWIVLLCDQSGLSDDDDLDLIIIASFCLPSVDALYIRPRCHFRRGY